MLPQVPLVSHVQPGQARDRVRLVPPEAQGAALLDHHTAQEEEEEGEAAAARGHDRRVFDEINDLKRALEHGKIQIKRCNRK